MIPKLSFHVDAHCFFFTMEMLQFTSPPAFQKVSQTRELVGKIHTETTAKMTEPSFPDGGKGGKLLPGEGGGWVLCSWSPPLHSPLHPLQTQESKLRLSGKDLVVGET